MCRRLKRDENEDVKEGTEKENVQLDIVKIDPCNNENLIVRVNKGNYKYGKQFHTKYSKLQKYVHEYKDWQKNEEEHANEECKEYCLPHFHFHEEFRNSECGVRGIEAYVVKFRSENGLPEMSEDSKLNTVVGIVNYIRSQHHLVSNKDKWDALREFLRNKHSMCKS